MSVRHLELADFRIFRGVSVDLGARGDHGHHGVERHREDQRARSTGLSRDPALLPRRAARGHGAHRRRERHRAGRARRPRQPHPGGGADPARRTQPHQGEPQGGQRQARSSVPPPRARSSRPRTSSSSAAVRRGGATSSTTRWRCSTPRGPGPPTRPTGSCASARRCCASRAAGAGAEVTATLDVWDQRLADAGKVLVAARERLVADLDPAGRRRPTATWPARGDDGARRASATCGAGTATSSTRWPPPGGTTCAGASTRWGPTATTSSSRSRGGRPRTHASQGEQRCLALALRLGVHELIRARTAAGPDPAPRRRLLRARPGPQPRPGGRAARRASRS